MNVDWNAVIWAVIIIFAALALAAIIVWGIVVTFFVKAWKSAAREVGYTSHTQKRKP